MFLLCYWYFCLFQNYRKSLWNKWGKFPIFTGLKTKKLQLRSLTIVPKCNIWVIALNFTNNGHLRCFFSTRGHRHERFINIVLLRVHSLIYKSQVLSCLVPQKMWFVSTNSVNTLDCKKEKQDISFTEDDSYKLTHIASKNLLHNPHTPHDLTFITT